MHTITVCYYSGTSQTFLFSSEAAARDGYEIIKTAMETYSPYGNDKTTTVTIKDEVVGETTIRLERIDSASLDDTSASEGRQREFAEFLGKLRGASKLAEAEVNPAPH